LDDTTIRVITSTVPFQILASGVLIKNSLIMPSKFNLRQKTGFDRTSKSSVNPPQSQSSVTEPLNPVPAPVAPQWTEIPDGSATGSTSVSSLNTADSG